MPEISENVWREDEYLEVRNIKKTRNIGGGDPGRYWTNSVRAAKQDGVLGNRTREAVRAYKCSNDDCNEDARVAAHVWIDGGDEVFSMYLVPASCATSCIEIYVWWLLQAASSAQPLAMDHIQWLLQAASRATSRIDLYIGFYRLRQVLPLALAYIQWFLQAASSTQPLALTYIQWLLQAASSAQPLAMDYIQWLLQAASRATSWIDLYSGFYRLRQVQPLAVCALPGTSTIPDLRTVVSRPKMGEKAKGEKRRQITSKVR